MALTAKEAHEALKNITTVDALRTLSFQWGSSVIGQCLQHATQSPFSEEGTDMRKSRFTDEQIVGFRQRKLSRATAGI